MRHVLEVLAYCPGNQYICTTRSRGHSLRSVYAVLFSLSTPRHAGCVNKGTMNAHMRTYTLSSLVTALAVLLVVLFSVNLLSAWSGPTSSAPSGNTPAPVNVGNTDQVKDGGLSLDALAVFGNIIVSGANNYLNFGTTAGASGYGFRNNNGTMQFKNQSGDWIDICNCAAPETPPEPTTKTWTAWTYADGYNYVYLASEDDITGPHTYGGNTFYVYNPVKIFPGTWSTFIANPVAAFQSAIDVPVGYSRDPWTRFIFNFAQLESESASSQASVAAGVFSFIPNRFMCAQNVVSSAQCHYNNIGVWHPGFSRTPGGALHGSYSDNNSGTGFMQYTLRYDFEVEI